MMWCQSKNNLKTENDIEDDRMKVREQIAANCCFKIFSDWTKFHAELRFLEQVFFKKRVTFVIC